MSAVSPRQEQGSFLDGTMAATQNTRTLVDKSWNLMPTDSFYSTDQSNSSLPQPLLEPWNGYWPQPYTEEQLHHFTNPAFADDGVNEHQTPGSLVSVDSDKYCWLCDKIFSKACDLRRHEVSIHPDSSQPSWICGCCCNARANPKEMFKNNRKDLLKQHLQKFHGLPKTQDPVECSLCPSEARNVLFPFKTCLENHEEKQHAIPHGISIFVDPGNAHCEACSSWTKFNIAQCDSQMDQAREGRSQDQHDCWLSIKGLPKYAHAGSKRQKRDQTGTVINDQRPSNFYLINASNPTSLEVPSIMTARLPNDITRHPWVPPSSQSQLLRNSPVVIGRERLALQKPPGTRFIGSQFYAPPFPGGSTAPFARSFGPSAENNIGFTSQTHSSPVPRALDAFSASTHAVTGLINDFSPTQFLILCNGLPLSNLP